MRRAATQRKEPVAVGGQTTVSAIKLTLSSAAIAAVDAAVRWTADARCTAANGND